MKVKNDTKEQQTNQKPQKKHDRGRLKAPTPLLLPERKGKPRASPNKILGTILKLIKIFLYFIAEKGENKYIQKENKTRRKKNKSKKTGKKIELPMTP